MAPVINVSDEVVVAGDAMRQGLSIEAAAPVANVSGELIEGGQLISEGVDLVVNSTSEQESSTSSSPSRERVSPGVLPKTPDDGSASTSSVTSSATSTTSSVSSSEAESEMSRCGGKIENVVLKFQKDMKALTYDLSVAYCGDIARKHLIVQNVSSALQQVAISLQMAVTPAVEPVVASAAVVPTPLTAVCSCCECNEICFRILEQRDPRCCVFCQSHGGSWIEYNAICRETMELGGRGQL